MHTITNEFRRGRRYEAQVRVLHDEPVTPDGAAHLADRDELERGFRRLSFEHRAVLVLRHLQGMTVPEIADALGHRRGHGQVETPLRQRGMRAALTADARSTSEREATA